MFYLGSKAIKRWKGFRLLAVDGTGIRVPDTPENRLIIGEYKINMAFDEIKNQLKLAVFSGYKSKFVLEDLWAVFIFYNIRAIFLNHAQSKLDNIKKDHQINRNITVAILHKTWSKLLLKNPSINYLKQLINLIIRYHEKRRIRPPNKKTTKTYEGKRALYDRKKLQTRFLALQVCKCL